MGAAVASVACCMLRIPELLTGSRTIGKQRVNFALRSHVCINACLSNNAFNLNGWLLARVEIGNYWSAASMPQPMHCDGNVFPPFSFPPPLSSWPLWPAVLVPLERIGLAISTVSGVRAIAIVV